MKGKAFRGVVMMIGCLFIFASRVDAGGVATVGEAGSAVRALRTPVLEGSYQERFGGGRVFFLDDDSAEIFAGSRVGGIVVCNRFVPGDRVILAAASFFHSGAAAGDAVEIVVYEDVSGMAAVPDAIMEVLRVEALLDGGGFQEVDLGGLTLNAAGAPEAAFFVGLASVESDSFSLGIDRSGPAGEASFISEDGGGRFVPLSEYPVIEGNAMIRARTAGPRPFAGVGARLRPGRFAGLDAAAPHEALHAVDDEGRFVIGTSSDAGRQGATRSTLINDLIDASSGSTSCPGCSPEPVPGLPRFTLGNPDLYEDYFTIENASGLGIAMPIRAVLNALTPESVEGFNTDSGGGRPPDGYWEYSASVNDGTDSADNVLDPGERITRQWQIADEGGDEFTFWVNVYGGVGADDETVLLLDGDGDGSSSEHTVTFHGDPQLDAATRKFGSGSMSFDGSDDYLSIPGSADWDFGSDDFTIDVFVKIPSGLEYYNDGIVTAKPNLSEPGWALQIHHPSGIYNYMAFEIDGAMYSTNFVIGDDQWHHLAVVKAGNTLMQFVDGVERGSWSVSGNVNSNGDLVVGQFNGLVSQRYFRGNIDELRITKGLVRWTENFTPPAGPGGADGFTSLLLHFDGDSSGRDHTVMCYNARLNASEKKWGGSFYFDGSGDYLWIPDSDDWYFGTGEFTVDFWVKKGRLNTWEGLIGQGNSTHSSISFEITSDSDNTVRGRVYQGTTQYDLDTTTAITDFLWHHIAYVRDRAQQKAYIFIDGIKAGERNLSNSVSVNQIANVLGVGIQGAYTGTLFNGYIDEVRVSKGVARWTDNFTPPTAPY